MCSDPLNFLDTTGTRLEQHSSRLVIMTLANELYEESEDTEEAVDMANCIIASSRRVMSHLPNVYNPLPAGNVQQNHNKNVPQHFSDRKSHDVGMRLKDAEKFCREVGECWMSSVSTNRSWLTTS